MSGLVAVASSIWIMSEPNKRSQELHRDTQAEVDGSFDTNRPLARFLLQKVDGSVGQAFSLTFCL